MATFQIQSTLDAPPSRLAPELLTLEGVNFELMPMVRMTAPRTWRQVPINDWPVAGYIFTSVILLFGFVPIDLHRFGLLSKGSEGFRESSSSLVMKTWRHRRTIEKIGNGARITDYVEFQPRLALLSAVLGPIYRQVFAHRHKRLRNKYGIRAGDSH